MEKNIIVKYLCELNSISNPERNQKISEETYIQICRKINYYTHEHILQVFPDIKDLFFSTETTLEWKYICLNLFLFKSLNSELEKSTDEVLSVQQSKDVKKCLKNIVDVGILTKIQPNLPWYLKPNECKHSEDIFLDYNILKCTTLILCNFLKCLDLRLLILPDNLKALLLSAYQIAYCPLKKPCKGTITEEKYQKLLVDKELFVKLLNELRNTIHPAIFIKETMVLLQAKSPLWFKKSISSSLTEILISKNGVESIACALLDGATNDSTQTWKILEVLSKLILSCKRFPDFQENICKQLLKLLDRINDNDMMIFERLFTVCTKKLFETDEKIAKNVLVAKIIGYFLHFTYNDHKFKEIDVITRKMSQNVRLLHSLFVENIVNCSKLPIDFLKPIINVIFRFYSLTLDSNFKSVNKELKDILIEFLKFKSKEMFLVYDSLFFGLPSKEILPFRNDITIEIKDSEFLMNYSDHVVTYSVSENSESLLKLIAKEPNFKMNLFGFLLNCTTNSDKYFKKSNDSLLNLETKIMSEIFERKLVVYKLLSDLAEDKNMQKSITDDPVFITNYIDNVLCQNIKNSTHKTTDFESEHYQSLFTIIMILEVLVNSSQNNKFKHYKVLLTPLSVIMEETSNKELKNLVQRILDTLKLENTSKSWRIHVEDEKTELDKALDDVCDPLLPTRGHGLMTLTKLVEKKHEDVLDRKQYILNIFQQNLKNEDSYIYLSAIGGLAAMADIFTDTVLNILCEEYSDFTRKDSDDGHEVRIKLGEILVRVTKLLGDMAPKYKPLLLNTFLIGAKDDDHMIRASSLSNLGEICRVLGFKLGTIITEILVCVHAVIATDKAPEARRAAIMIIKQLFVGLDKETIAVLKDDILPIYRTLKEIYDRDKDDIARLQAQLALEELNENMKNFVFPKPEINAEKKIIVLK